ncbi:HEBP2-like protein [Mya arenaria]|uniref:HEBP2-like protein n=1 Tax=Mya arenaria TaxID=6604 RepID=A0ABY7DQ49_MYAAR|nr:HEBP2-like protein [Mya arenaria]
MSPKKCKKLFQYLRYLPHQEEFESVGVNHAHDSPESQIMDHAMLTLVTVVLAALVGGSLQQPGILPDAFVPLHLGESGNGGVAQTDYVKPAFCHDLDCPKYTVMETNDKFEKRHYAPSVWVATTMNTTNYTRALNSQMFFKLFRYISGNNSAHQKLAMTAPVLTEHVFETSVAMQFMIPFAQQAAPPTPTEPKVYIRNVPETTFYVRYVPPN